MKQSAEFQLSEETIEAFQRDGAVCVRNGIGGMIASFTVVMFAFGGVEMIGITAGEAKDPKRVLPKAINSVPLRILLFYILTLFVLMAIYPWTSIGSHGSCWWTEHYKYAHQPVPLPAVYE
ncbi:amino acid permease-associated protein [Pseudomonas putida]|uniref:Amino acid permease/ SLC12A domain-containing protein n=1 Tax=Pseudomonas putida NBRC 14164 TaxID=1211579 RepID=A0ABN5UJQ5_PSEPU|nr:hypothetical protein PP4_19420 [Pseudomonas putida NBRC 14164]SUD71321.1 amino acid permease-associated protein [Pseudomonas putida]